MAPPLTPSETVSFAGNFCPTPHHTFFATGVERSVRLVKRQRAKDEALGTPHCRTIAPIVTFARLVGSKFCSVAHHNTL
jgi:hypothetical protein